MPSFRSPRRKLSVTTVPDDKDMSIPELAKELADDITAPMEDLALSVLERYELLDHIYLIIRKERGEAANAWLRSR